MVNYRFYLKELRLMLSLIISLSVDREFADVNDRCIGGSWISTFIAFNRPLKTRSFSANVKSVFLVVVNIIQLSTERKIKQLLAFISNPY